MKSLVTICCLLLLGSNTSAQAQNATTRAFDPLMNRLQTVKWISNHDPGWGGNEFYKLSKELLKSHAPSDYRRMVNQSNPIVRAMGLLCLTQIADDDSVMLLLAHWQDEAVVYFHQGCIVSRITVGEFAQLLLSNPHFLDPSTRRPAI